MKKAWVLSYPSSTQRRLIRLIWVFAERSHFVCFVMRRLISDTCTVMIPVFWQTGMGKHCWLIRNSQSTLFAIQSVSFRCFIPWKKHVSNFKDLKSTLSLPVVYATDGSKVAPVLFLFCMALWFFYRAFHVVLPCSLFSFFFSVMLIGEARAGLYASRTLVCLSCMC